MIGALIGSSIGAQVGANLGDGTSAGGGIVGVTRDAASGWYFPASAGEWTIFMAAAGLATGNPSSGHLCQEPSGNLADSIGSVTLTQSGAGHLYQQTVAGFTRKAVTTVDGTANQKWINSTVAPNPNTTSTGYLAAIRMPAANPAAARDLLANGGTLDLRMAATGKINAVNGATTAGTGSPVGTVQLVYLQRDITNSLFTCYTLQEKIVGTFGAVVSNPMFVLGGQTTVAADAGYLADYLFAGAAAEQTSGQVKTLFQTLTGLAVPWS